MQLSISTQAVSPESELYESTLEQNDTQKTFSYSGEPIDGQPIEFSRAVSSPASLMARLMEKASSLLDIAALGLQKNEVESFQNATLHASQIILSLRCLLDKNSADHLSKEMFVTYTMIATGLKRAREDRDVQAITAINSELAELKTAWRSVA